MVLTSSFLSSWSAKWVGCGRSLNVSSSVTVMPHSSNVTSPGTSVNISWNSKHASMASCFWRSSNSVPYLSSTQVFFCITGLHIVSTSVISSDSLTWSITAPCTNSSCKLPLQTTTAPEIIGLRSTYFFSMFAWNLLSLPSISSRQSFS